MNTFKSIFIICLLITQNITAQKTIVVDFQNQTGEIKDILGVNRGPSHRDAGYMDAGISMIRTHDYHDAFDYAMYSQFWYFDSINNEFTTINEDFEPDNPTHYNWFATDSVIANFDEINCDIYFRLGTSYPNENYVIQPADPPLDPDGLNFTNFAELCKRTVMHCNGDWSNGLNKDIRYWEIWNEPEGLFWNGTPLQFFSMYKTARDSIKSFDPDLKVGALSALPTTTLEIDTTYSSGFFNWLQANNSSIDFYSWHIYGIQNPYALMELAQNMRTNLDEHGFTEAESHVTEINNNLEPWLPQFTDSPEGCAYYASHYITAQMAPVDKLFWYTGVGFFHYDTSGMANLTWSAYAMKSFKYLRDETPIQIYSNGNEVIDGHWETDTTNFMALAGKSSDDKKLYILVSNYNSNYQDYNIEIQNLPWNSNDEIEITRNIIKGPNDKFTEIKNYQTGSSTMNLMVNSMPAPSMILLRIKRVGFANIDPVFNKKPEVYPNPVNNQLFVDFGALSSSDIHHKTIVSIVNINGTVIKQVDIRYAVSERNSVYEIDVTDLLPGIYFVKISNLNDSEVHKIVKF